MGAFDSGFDSGFEDGGPVPPAAANVLRSPRYGLTRSASVMLWMLRLIRG